MEHEWPVHHALVDTILRTGASPSFGELQARFALSASDLTEAIRRLEAAHGVVLHPGTVEPWIVHPFALSPSATWVAGEGRGWWAPCMWCALGVAALAGGRVTIHGRLGGEVDDVDVVVVDGQPAATDLLAHFAVPARDAWNNVHHYCNMVLPFRSEADIDAWSARHRLPRGQAVPLFQVAVLARLWYGRHADPAWRKWTVAEAQALFAAAGLTGEFWDLGAGAGRF
jgi:hypothetical protein